MRTLVPLLLGCLPVIASGVEYPVMLDEPGTFEAIQRQEPAKFKQLNAILVAAQKYGCASDLPKMLQAEFGVTSAKCTGYAMMSEPTKTRLTFRLDGTLYSTIWVPATG